MVAAVLAGGLGMRLRPVIGGTPKALAPVDRTPFIEFLLDQLGEAGVSRIVVCAGHGGAQLRRALEGRRAGTPLVVSQEAWPMGTGGALRQAFDHFDSETVLVLNGDSYVDTSLAQFCTWQQSHPFPSALLLTWAENTAESGAVEVDATGRILALGVNRGIPQAGWVDAGVYLLSRAWLEALPHETPLSLERDVFPFWIERGLGGYCVRAPFLDIGTPEGLAQAPSFFASLGKKSKAAEGLSQVRRA